MYYTGELDEMHERVSSFAAKGHKMFFFQDIFFQEKVRWNCVLYKVKHKKHR